MCKMDEDFLGLSNVLLKIRKTRKNKEYLAIQYQNFESFQSPKNYFEERNISSQLRLIFFLHLHSHQNTTN